MKTPRFEIYEDTARYWRWRLRARNGRIVADSGEGYSTRRGIVRAVLMVGRTTSWAVLTIKELKK